MSRIIPTWAGLPDKPTAFPPQVHVHDWTDITGKPTEFPPSSHNHNDLYYTESEIRSLIADFATDAELFSGLAGKANSSHSHNASEINNGTLADARLSSNVALVPSIISPRFLEIRWNGGTTQFVSGSGTTGANETQLTVQSGTTANSRSARGWPSATNDMFIAGALADQRNLTTWNRLDLCFVLSRTTVVSGTGQSWFKFGVNATIAGDLTGGGLQVRVNIDSLTFGMHNGTTLSLSPTVALTGTISSNFIRIFMTRAGDCQCFLNGVLAHTFPPSQSFLDLVTPVVCCEVQNGATAANQRTHFSPIRMLVQ